MKYRHFLVSTVAAVVLLTGRQGAAQGNFPFEIFGRYLEPLVAQLGIPGVSAAIIQTFPNSRTAPVIHPYSVGFADLEQKIPTRIDTPYAIGGVTQAMTGVLAGVCIDRFPGVFNVDSYMRVFVPSFPFELTSVRQVLSHSSDGRFRYDPQLFTQLTPVIESKACLNEPFRRAMVTEVINRVRGVMTRTVPGMDLNRPEGEAARALFDASEVDRYRHVLADLAVPYKVDAKGRATRSEYPSYGLDAASGMVSTVEDLAKFEMELDSDDGIPLSSSTLTKMWSNQGFELQQPNGSTIRLVMPTGLGWFVTRESGVDLVWTFGRIQDASSALIVKMPAKGLTLIMLANSDGLARNVDFENANVTSSPFVKVFLRLFINQDCVDPRCGVLP